MPYLSSALNVMVSAARKAGRGLIRDFGEIENLQVSMKGPGDFVSTADKRTENQLLEELTRARPGYCFLLEEGGAVDGPDKSHRFIIDPIDGTTNFLHGIPHFAISIGLERDGQLVSAVVFNPVNAEMFVAAKGQGAYLNGIFSRIMRKKMNLLAGHSGLGAATGLPGQHRRDEPRRPARRA
jgi:myo-inositol-1(or 4)-monophosphatase